MERADTSPRESSPLALRLMFEWRGGTLWADDEATFERFDVGAIEDMLGLPSDLLERLEALSLWHDTALDWDDPGGPSPWTADEGARFDAAAEAMRADLERAFGPGTRVRYVP